MFPGGTRRESILQRRIFENLSKLVKASQVLLEPLHSDLLSCLPLLLQGSLALHWVHLRQSRITSLSQIQVTSHLFPPVPLISLCQVRSFIHGVQELKHGHLRGHHSACQTLVSLTPHPQPPVGFCQWLSLHLGLNAPPLGFCSPHPSPTSAFSHWTAVPGHSLDKRHRRQ